MKKIVSLFLAVALFSALLVGCSTEQPATSPQNYKWRRKQKQL